MFEATTTISEKKYPGAFRGSSLGATAAIKTGSGRLEMAEWMASPRNPLAARVAVNRIWQHHFGHGIVRSTDNFGKTGEPPTHPELLDYLATRFVESGWSIKAMHRMMVLSSVYQMSSRTGENTAPVDPQNGCSVTCRCAVSKPRPSAMRSWRCPAGLI